MRSSCVGRQSSSASSGEVIHRRFANRIGQIAVDGLAGAIVAAGNIALAVSFAALLFQGELRGGFALGLWSLLMSMVVTTVVVNAITSIPPISAGPDTSMVAVMTLLAAVVFSQVLALGGTTDLAVAHTLLAFSLTTLLAGIVVFLVGAKRWGQVLRFVPFPVVGGFLAATGVLLMGSSYKVATGEALTIAALGYASSQQTLAKAVAALAFAFGLLFARNRIKASFFLPLAFFSTAVTLDFGLWTFAPDTDSWFIRDAQDLKPWIPILVATSVDIHWAVLLKALPEIATCVAVGIISLVVKISSVETGRSAAADMNQEFRANGAANLIAAPLGAMAGSVLVTTSKAFMDAGARTQLSGIVAAALIGLVVLARVDLPSFVPTPVIAGFLLVMGYTMLTDALKGAIRQKSWMELVLALAIALTCLCFGFIIGVLAGFVCSCLIFAWSYGRIGVVRRHLTRASFSGNVERAPEIERLLRREGDAIHIYWLSGYIFFGSSEALFERVRQTVSRAAATPPRYIVLDLAGASGMDSSAIVSLLKLQNFCDKCGVALAYADLAASLQRPFQRAGLLGDASRHRAFANRNMALDWCEEQLLAEAGPEVRTGSTSEFEHWLAQELGGAIRADIAMGYFERSECKDGDVLYRQGDPADSIDFIAAGTLAISIDDARAAPRRIRRSAQHTVLGEMGFFRETRRAATISSEGPAVIYTLSRDNLDRMHRNHPELHEALLRFVIRTLSDRLALAHKEVAALT